ncbi:hypothetical protein ACTFIZ_012887 [Dictyostelium cf. discoideum]
MKDENVKNSLLKLKDKILEIKSNKPKVPKRKITGLQDSYLQSKEYPDVLLSTRDPQTSEQIQENINKSNESDRIEKQNNITRIKTVLEDNCKLRNDLKKISQATLEVNKQIAQHSVESEQYKLKMMKKPVESNNKLEHYLGVLIGHIIQNPIPQNIVENLPPVPIIPKNVFNNQVNHVQVVGNSSQPTTTPTQETTHESQVGE